MAIAFPSFVDALVGGFSPAFKETGVLQHEHIEDSQNVGEYLEKLFGRLSALLFHMDRQINNVLIRGGRLPKKLTQWATEARTLKVRVSDLLKEQKKSAELVEVGIRMITHLKKCPFKDDMMYDKPIPIMIRNPESSLKKPSRRLEEKKYKVEVPHTEGKKMEHKHLETEPSFSTSRGDHVRQQDQHTEENVSVENRGSEPLSTLESKLGTVIFPVDSNSSSLPISKIEQQFADETAEMGILPEDNEAKMLRNMPISGSGIKSENQGEIEIVDEMRILNDAEYSVEQQEIEPSSSNEERNKHQKESITSSVWFKENGLYSVVSQSKHLLLKLDNQIISIGDYPSPVNAMIDLVGENLHELPDKPNYSNSLILLLQRNKHLPLIHHSFFDSMPALSFLDMSDTKIRILPSSLFDLSKLKVLLLRNCICLEKLPPEIGKLRLMEALDLLGTELYNLPDETGQLALMRSLHLSFYGPDDESEYEDLPLQLVSPGFFSELKKVQTLSVSVHPEDHRWNETVASIINDISKMEMLSYLQFYFPQVETFETFIQMSPSWKKESLRKFDFTIGQNVKRIASRVPDEVESLFSREERCLRYVNGDEASPLVKSVLTHVTSFYLDHHTKARSLSEFDVSNLQGLRFCVVRECPKMEAILDERNAGSGNAFPHLEHLRIYFLWELEHVSKPAPQTGRLKRMFKTPTPSRNFEALRYLIISTCPKLRFVVRESMLQCLTNLEELLVEDCECVERIIEGEKKKVRRENNILPCLKKLELRYLPELVSLGCGVCFSEEKLSVYGCPKLILSC